MSRKIIQLGYLVPNTDRNMEAFEEVLKYFVDKGCLAKEGVKGFKRVGLWRFSRRNLSLLWEKAEVSSSQA